MNDIIHFTDSVAASPAMMWQEGDRVMRMGGMGGGPVEIVVVVLLALTALAAIVFWIWMIVDAIRKEPKDQAMWILIMLLTNITGAVAYFFAVKRKMDKAGKPQIATS